MANYLDDAALLVKLQNRLHLSDGTLANWWTSVVGDANNYATQKIRSKLLARGFSLTQISGWEGVQEFALRLAVCHAMRIACTTQAYDQSAVEAICKVEEELDTVALVVNNEIIVPASPRRITHGQRSTENDVFKIEDFPV